MRSSTTYTEALRARGGIFTQHAESREPKLSGASIASALRLRHRFPESSTNIVNRFKKQDGYGYLRHTLHPFSSHQPRAEYSYGDRLRGGREIMTATTIMPSFVSDSTAQLALETTASHTIVLQPKGCLGGIAVLDFQINLEQALEMAALRVVVDMQQVDVVAPDGIAVLARGLELAAILGKSIVFDSLDLATYIGLRAEWRNSREICFGPWGDLFEGEFEQFLTDEMLRSLPCEAVKPTFLQFAKLDLPSG